MKIKLSSGKQVVVRITHVQEYPDLLSMSEKEFRHKAWVWKRLGYMPGTHAVFVSPDGEEFEGIARLSIYDQFNRHKGVSVALRRALARSGLNRTERSEVWSKVFGGKYGRVAAGQQGSGL